MKSSRARVKVRHATASGLRQATSGGSAGSKRASPADEVRRPDPDVDANGVDRAQIRAMLALTPEQRLRHVEGFVAAALEIRELNGTGPLR